MRISISVRSPFSQDDLTFNEATNTLGSDFRFVFSFSFFLYNAGRRGLEKSLGPGLTPPLPLSAQRCGHSAPSGCLVLSAVAGF